MNARTLFLIPCLLMSVAGATAHAATTTVESTTPDPLLVAAIKQKLDTSHLVLPTLSAVPASSASFDFNRAVVPQNIERILPSGELFSPTLYYLSGEETTSNSFQLEIGRTRGSFFLTLRDDVIPRKPLAVTGGDSAVLLDARNRLKSLGFATAETSGAFVRHLKRFSHPVGSNEERVQVVSTKVFVDRTLGGIEVNGSRAVLTYDATGSFRRVIGRWPTLAASGHRLKTTLSIAQISDAVAKQLASMPSISSPTQPIPLRSLYTANPQPDGKVVLQLSVEATLLRGGEEESQGPGGKIRQILVPLTQ